MDNVTTLPWRVKIGDSTVAAAATGEQAVAIGLLMTDDLVGLTVSFTTEKV